MNRPESPPSARTAEFDPLILARRVRSLPGDTSPAVLAASQELYTPFHETEPYRAVQVLRDLAYGEHDRHRLDLFKPDTGRDGAPVLLFVHGGGFIGGGKKRPGTPYQDNVALWAVRHGMIGVNMTYRFAPQYCWPAGAEDVAGAIEWLAGNVALHGGDPKRIILMGTSAGAVHAATYVARRELHPTSGSGIAGAVFLSGHYDIASARATKHLQAYFGEDASKYPERSSLGGLLDSDNVLMFVIAECDPPDFERQALKLVNAYYERHGRWPRFLRLMGHNHFTTTLHLNTPDECLGSHICDLIHN